MKKLGLIILCSLLSVNTAFAQFNGIPLASSVSPDARDKTYETKSDKGITVYNYWWQSFAVCGTKLMMLSDTYNTQDPASAAQLKQMGEILAKLSIVRLMRDRQLAQDPAVQLYYKYTQSHNTMETSSIMLNMALDKQNNKLYAQDGELGKHTKLVYTNCGELFQKYQIVFADEFQAPK